MIFSSLKIQTNEYKPAAIRKKKLTKKKKKVQQQTQGFKKYENQQNSTFLDFLYGFRYFKKKTVYLASCDSCELNSEYMEVTSPLKRNVIFVYTFLCGFLIQVLGALSLASVQGWVRWGHEEPDPEGGITVYSKGLGTR